MMSIQYSIKNKWKFFEEFVFDRIAIGFCTLFLLPERLVSIMLQDTFLGEILGAVVLANSPSSLDAKFEVKPIKVLAQGVESSDGKTVVDEKRGKLVRILSHVDAKAYYDLYAKRLGDQNQSAKVGSFGEQKRKWSHPHTWQKLERKRALVYDSLPKAAHLF